MSDLSIAKGKAEADDYEFDRHAEDVAEERGQVVLYPLPTQLQIDLDTDIAYTEFYRRFDSVDFDTKDWPIVEELVSGSGLPHRHIILTFKRPFDEWERIALQAALGDDPIRTFLNAKRKIHGIEKPTRLFRPKP